MGRSQRNKGARGELEACEALAGVWPNLQRGLTQTRGGGDCPDIDAPAGEPRVPWWVEVKRGARAPHPAPAYEQARQASDGRPPLVLTRADRGPWLVTMALADAVPLLRGERSQVASSGAADELEADIAAALDRHRRRTGA